ncbi:Hpt domain-containing protein [Sulfitobacter albidus]|uniref:Hpt domain-containing protein n=1 Tax=Sulfitobacter albidus TaxID=2829501 RepID=A0A975PME4_9RHOB|nr:Hpt domain-containing protein [Sulfitobacter albidus]QUJ76713.1 Hpt domain-containing protein [Sulfitobacter albidus]
MNAAALELPGLDKIRARFVEMLEERSSRIAQHALAAWDAETAEEINRNLSDAKDILHQIAGSAGTVGFPELGAMAQECEMEIIAHLDGEYADLAVCPGQIIWRIDGFVASCLELRT